MNINCTTNFVFKNSYPYIKGYGPTMPNAHEVFWNELTEAREEVMLIYTWTSPAKDHDKFYTRVMNGSVSDLIEIIREDYGRFYDADEIMSDMYWNRYADVLNPATWEKINSPDCLDKLSCDRDALNSVLPRLLEFVPIDEARRALAEMQELVEDKCFFFHCRRHTRTAELMRATMLHDMEVVIEFCYQYSGKRHICV